MESPSGSGRLTEVGTAKVHHIGRAPVETAMPAPAVVVGGVPVQPGLLAKALNWLSSSSGKPRHTASVVGNPEARKPQPQIATAKLRNRRDEDLLWSDVRHDDTGSIRQKGVF